MTSASGGGSLENQNNTISGSGNIGNGSMAFTNDAGGVVNATSAHGNSLVINPGGAGATNLGLMEASSGGTLVIDNTLTNTGGTVTALAGTGTNAGGTVVINGATVTGGTLKTLGIGVNSGVIISQSGATLNSITNLGTIQVPNGNTTFLEGTITNNGSLQLNSNGSLNTFIELTGNVILNGTGTLTLSNASSNFIQGTVGTEILTNNSTIQGSGNIGNGLMGLVNNASGKINANQSNPLLIDVSSKGFTNNGTLNVSSGDLMHVEGGPFTNFSSSTLTGGTYNVSGTLEIDQLGSSGGEIVTNAANIILNGASSSFVDAGGHPALTNLNTNATGGSFTITGGQNFTTAGDFTNNGTLTVGASNSTFKVSGNLTNISGSTISGGTYNLTGILKANNASGITTNSANITLTGGGALENQSGANALTGLATNSSGASFTINGGANFTTAGDFTNNGTLTVGASNSTFKVSGNLSNISGSTISGGTYNLTGILKANNASGITTNSASITLTGSGALENQSGANALTGLATNSSGASFTVAGGQKLTTSAAAFVNAGSLTTTGSGSQFSTTGSASFTNNGTLTTTGGDSETATGASGSFTNNGTLTVGSGSTFATIGSLTNFSGTTLTGGTYNVTGTFEFPGANIMTNAANITLTGKSSRILNSSNGTPGLANFATNAAAGSFSLQSSRTFTTVGNFSNAGTFTIGSGSAFTVGGPGVFTQTGGKTTDDGTLTDSGGFSLNGGSLSGRGTITGSVTASSSGTITPGDSATATGILKDTGTYTQNSGTLDISIDGTAAGTQYDQLNPTTAILSGTLNINRPTNFVPSVGKTFKIMNFSLETGTFSTVNGLAINSTEHFTITYESTDVLLTVVSGPCPLPCTAPLAPSSLGQFNSPSTLGPTYSAAEPWRLGFRLEGRGSLIDSPHFSPRLSAMGSFGVDAQPSFGGISRASSASVAVVGHESVLSLGMRAAFRPTHNFTAAMMPRTFLRPHLDALIHGKVNPAAAVFPRNAGILGRKRVEYSVDLLSILGMSLGHSLRGRLGSEGGANFGYLMFTGSN